MDSTTSPHVAILLATYNGSSFVEEQLTSLRDNEIDFTLHWLDDHSTDNTRDVVRQCARQLGIRIKEWHQESHEGLPGAFFRLLELVEADIYLFCDQDDIWEPRKIDTIVLNLMQNLSRPKLCHSMLKQFRHGDAPSQMPSSSTPRQEVFDRLLHESKSFMCCPSVGSTQGFTRALREVFIRHKEIAREYAQAHDWWIYLIALGLSSAKLLRDVPTTWHRVHTTNATKYNWTNRLDKVWNLQRILRKSKARQAEGFILASKTMPQSVALRRLVCYAQLVVTINKRQSLVNVLRLMREGVLWGRHGTFWLVSSCLLTDAGKLVPGEPLSLYGGRR